ncbi:TfpX/TfpZ family type IV pilin accessory protein [Variovorax terrae]|uniref:Pilus assembly protein n=1 Tax=Variovorax terrae TaxID=2923278 RepID=A0A9X1VXT7_9BURK|nr:TfpX/TfpZ family type IV pilin accessory protein [Variovorax terrae]MCJ0765806.1 pilus assembly protein [Variovorax terrae]
MFNWKDRLKAAGIHFGISLVVAALSAALVFGLWYPYPYRDISGGRDLFLLVVSVDVILGPLITFTIFNRTKSRRSLQLDFSVIGLVQLAALSYGLWTVFLARPVHLVFEYDRFRVVHAVDIPPSLLNQAPPGLDALPLTGPTLLSLRAFKDSKEQFDSTMAALQGLSLSARPELWQSYEAGKPAVLKAAKPVSELKRRFEPRSAEIDQVIRAAGRQPDALVYLPLAGRQLAWTAFLDPATAQVVAFMPLDSF